MELSGRSTVFRWLRPMFMAAPGCQPAAELASSRVSVLATPPAFEGGLVE